MPDISPQELQQRIDNGETINLIDVREVWEHDEQNIGGENIPLGLLPLKAESLEHLKEEEIILYCKSGGRSGRAKMFLTEKGFKNVRNLPGGIEKYLNL